VRASRVRANPTLRRRRGHHRSKRRLRKSHPSITSSRRRSMRAIRRIGLGESNKKKSDKKNGGLTD
jgi:hypothetical protein